MKGLRTWIEIDRKKIKNNYDVFRSLLAKDTRFCGVVKSNAYGHDFRQYAKELENLGIDFLAVDSIVEALKLRQLGIKVPILVLGHTLPERVQEAVSNNISISISTFEALENVRGENVKVHLKIDTGMSRQGFMFSEKERLFNSLDGVNIEGVFTHFFAAKNPSLSHDTNRQIGEFKKWKKEFENKGYKPIFHASATSGTLLYPEAHFDMVRVGIGLYGLWPSVEAREHLDGKIKLQPVMKWKSVVAEVKEVPKGSKVGYDGTVILERDSTLAVCPFGYWHGYSRRLSGIGKVYINGKRVKVLGRISMDITTLDVTDLNVKVGDEVELIGENVSAYDMALWDDTSWYETVTRINPLIRRVYK